MVERFINKTVPFQFRGIRFTFDLSQGLFSSAGVDKGTQLLLKVLSRILDEDETAGKAPPRMILDSGCGTGVMGICAAAAIKDASVRCQDRDELARLVTLHNAAKNAIPPAALSAHTEPLLAGPPDIRYDLILTNIPAKAGAPVLADFVRRSAGLLNPGGRVIMVAVQPLAALFREYIAAGAELIREEQGSGHCVFVYGKGTIPAAPAAAAGTDFYARYACYIRAAVDCTLEDIPLHITGIHGAPNFDQPGGAVTAAAKLIASGLPIRGVNGCPLLIHEPGQGFFPCWLLEFMRRAGLSADVLQTTPTDAAPAQLVLSGRNILALEAARKHTAPYATASLVPAADLPEGAAALREAAGGGPYGCIAAFPVLLPPGSLPKGVDQLAAIWDTLKNPVSPLLACGGIFIAAFGSSDAERFDRKKPAGFTRQGTVKRNGFRALAYRFTPTTPH